MWRGDLVDFSIYLTNWSPSGWLSHLPAPSLLLVKTCRLSHIACAVSSEDVSKCSLEHAEFGFPCPWKTMDSVFNQSLGFFIAIPIVRLSISKNNFVLEDPAVGRVSSISSLSALPQTNVSVRDFSPPQKSI